MKKIAILTHSVANNYGANLQALSTACYLRNHGYVPFFLQWGSYITGNTPDEQASIHKSFLRKCGFHISEPLVSNEDFSSYIKSECIDRIIVGSDCVLTYDNIRFPYRLTRKGIIKIKKTEDYKFPNPFWLPFLIHETNIKRALMSASCGGGSSMKITEKDVLISMKNLLDQFNYISVRDSFTEKFLKDILPHRNDILITPDPVFGFNKNVPFIPTSDEIKTKYKITGDYYVLSFYHCNWPNQKWANSFLEKAHDQNIKCVSVLMPQGGRNSNFDIDVDLPIDPLDWYALIKYSKGYIGNNMHPIIVALHNNVPFFSFNIHGRSYLHGRIQLLKTSKEYDLLSRFGLQKNITPQPFLKLTPIKTIINRLIDFDMEKSYKASRILQDEYTKMMNTMLEKLM